MVTPRSKKYFFLSILFHIVILLLLVLGFDFITPPPVIENTNKNDVISAVVLGESPKSKVLPQQQTPPSPQKIEQDISAKNIVPPVKKEVIAIHIQQKKQPERVAKNLLLDIKKLRDQQKKLKQKQLQAQFEKTLRHQAEQSMRQQLLNEDIKLQGTQAREAQGIVNKYKALILQAISEHWMIPPQINKNLSCQLMIRLAPGGTVLDVQITQSSGDPALDSSARAAVLKASPLPVPSDSAAFDAFRQFVLKVKPENILDQDV